jgi:hypothetical protein
MAYLIARERDDFTQLSMKDLVEGREMFHIHLMNKKNVVATAIGRYLIRKTEIDEYGNSAPTPHKTQKTKRTLENSVVTGFSWPCVLVFVNKWEDDTILAERNTGDIVPKSIYMPDGRVIPICVVEAPTTNNVDTTIDASKLTFPTNLMGGGFPVKVSSQNAEHIASAGCIVSDGHTYYLLTNKHVAGNAGQQVTSITGDKPINIGSSIGVSMGKIRFSELYPDWKSETVKVNCDAGLVWIKDIKRWKTDVLGMGTMGPLYDLNTQTLNLGLIAEHKVLNGAIQTSESGNVKAYGAVSGVMEGEILALFYRYQALGGIEYVSDFLISGRNNKLLNAHHGDSGTVWFLEEKDDHDDVTIRPIALLWGQHQVINTTNKKQFPFVLATNLTNICRDLDVELVRGWNLDNEYSWGKIGHYTVGNLAVLAMAAGDAKTLFGNNLTNISFDKEQINKDLLKKGNPALAANPDEGFCPLADVPDIIWKQFKKSHDGTTGTDWGRRGDENPNHYADADARTPDGLTLYDYCKNVNDLKIANWTEYYNTLDIAAGIDVTDTNNTWRRGLVCFRVWQIFNYVIDAAAANRPDKFIFGCGVLAHYVGDACQPLHSSYMSDGDPADTTTENHVAKRISYKRDGTVSHHKGDVYPKKVNPGSGVHVAYEDHMIDDHIAAILEQLPAQITIQKSNHGETIAPITTGQEAGFAVLTLMRLTQQEITPKSIVEAFKTAKANHADISSKLYEQFGGPTVNVMARGARYLAAIWQAAWDVPGNKITSLAGVESKDLITLYRDPKELQSYHLDTIFPILR